MEIKIKDKLYLSLIILLIAIYLPIEFVCGRNIKQCFIQNTTVKLKNNVFYSFVFIDKNKYQIKWGNGNYSNVSIDTFKAQGNGYLSLYKSNKKAIVLEQGCGTSCNHYVILPLKKDGEEKRYYNLIALSLENNLIAYCSDSSFINVEDYSVGKKMIFYTNDLCPAALSVECVDRAYFKGKELFIYWQGSNWKENKKDKKSMRVLINF